MRLFHRETARPSQPPEGEQSLDVYYTDDMRHMLETWGEGNAWNEIQFLAAPLSGTFLDIACGTGKVMEILRDNLGKNVKGCDISTYLLEGAWRRGFSREDAIEADATKLPYADNAFDYSYSIGSLEHFTLEGISAMLGNAARVSRIASFHQIPVTRSGNDEGWITPVQAYFNNSIPWWRFHFQRHFGTVIDLPSSWSDRRSVGRWFIGLKTPKPPSPQSSD